MQWIKWLAVGLLTGALVAPLAPWPGGSDHQTGQTVLSALTPPAMAQGKRRIKRDNLRYCPDGGFWLPSFQTCAAMCPPGFPGCIPKGGCPRGALWNAKLRRCIPQVYHCPAGQYWDTFWGSCRTKPLGQLTRCPPHLYWNAALGECISCQLGPGVYWDSQNRRCVYCEEGSHSHWDAANRRCIRCPAELGMIWEPQTNECRFRCPRGMSWSRQQRRCLPVRSGTAIPTCPEGMFWDQVFQRCRYQYVRP